VENIARERVGLQARIPDQELSTTPLMIGCASTRE